MNQVTRTDQRFLFISDVDDTLLGDDDALSQLTDALNTNREEIAIAFNSSRPCASIRKSIEQSPNLPRPDYVIGALGTEIEHFETGQNISGYIQYLMNGWRRDEVAALMNEMGFSAHDPEFQTAFKASYHVPGEQYKKVLEQLEEKQMEVKVIYSGNGNLDIIPTGADKGNAVEFMRQILGFEREQVIVAGDSGNDLDMFTHGFKGIVVGNADETLRSLSEPGIYHAQANCAAGVLEGLRHWGVIRPDHSSTRRK